MTSFEKFTQHQSLEELRPEQIPTKEKSIFEKFQGKAKELAGVLTLVTALSMSPGLTREAFAEEQTKQPAEKEQIKEMQKIFKEFLVKEKNTSHEFKIKFLSSDIGKVMEQQNIKFNNDKGSFTLSRDKQVNGLEFGELNGVSTNMVEVDVVKIKLGEINRENLKIKVYNSDGSIQTLLLYDGQLVGVTDEKPQK